MKSKRIWTREEAKELLAPIAASAPDRVRAPAAEPALLRSGDTAGRFTFLGIDARGQLLCRCACGALETVQGRYLAEPLRQASGHRRHFRQRLRCAACQALTAELHPGEPTTPPHP